jgi:hypothetical protein
LGHRSVSLMSSNSSSIFFAESLIFSWWHFYVRRIPSFTTRYSARSVVPLYCNNTTTLSSQCKHYYCVIVL